MLSKRFIEIYLDYANNYVSISKIAAAYDESEKDMEKIISKWRELYNERFILEDILDINPDINISGTKWHKGKTAMSWDSRKYMAFTHYETCHDQAEEDEDDPVDLVSYWSTPMEALRKFHEEHFKLNWNTEVESGK